ncbi:MAG: RNA polymerase sigma factor [Planctomycetaceae bacterium]
MIPSLEETTISVSEESDISRELVNRVLDGDANALAELFAMYRQRLWRMVNFRLHRSLQGRVDADDVLQEAYINATKRLDSFLQDASRSVFIWFRLIVGQTLVDVHRRHISAQSRDARREFSIQGGFHPDSTSMSMSFHLLGHLTSPSQVAMKQELSQQLETALKSMNEIDREVLALRHFEELTNVETAQVLNISQQAASVRYIRALSRLKDVMKAIPGFTEDRPEFSDS